MPDNFLLSFSHRILPREKRKKKIKKIKKKKRQKEFILRKKFIFNTEIIETEHLMLLQVKQAIRIRRTTCNIFDEQIQSQSMAWQDGQTNRWYLLVPDSNLKEIRAKYWKDTNSTQNQEEENPKNELVVNRQVSMNKWPMGYQTLS